ncbi:MAG: thiamine phosphate synthase [Thermoguttaceae bacterium]|jgi:thiamine-phosphate pyrophosphorylase
MNQKLVDQLLLYAITYENIELETLLRQVEETLEGGATILQLREKTIDKEDYLFRAIAVKKICDRFNVPFIVDDAVEVAAECNASGVHLGQSDIDTASARKILGPDKIIGASAKNVDEALVAQENGADYIGCGAIYETNTKEDHTEASIEMLTRVCAAVSIPVVAIGGIKEHNMTPLKNSGVVGVAVVSGIFAAPDVKETTRAFRAKAEKLFLE